MSTNGFDVIVLGAGPGGEHATGALLREGARVALVEGELLGGECSHWACIPTKTLLRPPEVRGESARVAGVSEPRFDWPAIRAYREYMTSAHDDSGHIRGYREKGVDVVKARGRISGAGTVEAGGRRLQAERILVATGSEAVIPPIKGLQEAGYWTNRGATDFQEIPDSVIVLGGGPVGVELAQMFARFGSATALIQGPDRLLNRETPELGRRLAEQLARDGVELHIGRRADAVRRDGGGRVVSLDDGSELAAAELVVATGRTPRTADLGLETVGIEASPKGIAVDERCRAGDGVWAIGDCTGQMLFTHMAKYQARLAVADMLGRPARADYRAIPRVVFTHPEVAAVGMTEEQAAGAGLDAASAAIELPGSIARPYTYEQDPGGSLGVLVDREREILLGAWAMAPLASEWIHQAGLAIRAEIPLAVLRDTVAQFPSYSEGYLAALHELPDELAGRTGDGFRGG